MNEQAKEIVTVCVFVGASLAFAFGGDHRELASACLGCAITLVTPRSGKVPPAIVGAAAALLVYFVT